MDMNHTIVWSSDQRRSATFMAEMLGRPAPSRLGPFESVALDNGLSLLFMGAEGPIQAQHYAFLTSEAEFDAIFERLRSKGLAYWADPYHRRPDAINRNDGGRGVYFEDPDGHDLEVLTRPYGSSVS